MPTGHARVDRMVQAETVFAAPAQRIDNRPSDLGKIPCVRGGSHLIGNHPNFAAAFSQPQHGL